MDVEKLKQYLYSKEYLELAKQKIEFHQKIENDPLAKIYYWKKFSTDIVDFAKKCLVVYEPRIEKYREIIFNPFDYQKEIWKKLDEVYKKGGDFFIEKSRDMGVSWAIMAWVLHKWIFDPHFTCLLGSRKEEEVDSKGINSLFGKLRWMLYSLPDFLIPKGFKKRNHDNHLRLINPENGAIVEGESSNPNWSRGRRVSIAILDELFFWENYREALQAVYDSSPARVYISTPQPDSFAKRFVENLKQQGKVLTLHWSNHPFKTLEWFEKQKQSRSEVKTSVLNELEISYDIDPEEAYYPEAYEVQSQEIHYNPDYPLYVGIDTAGYKDYTALVWAQYYNDRLIVLDALVTHGQIVFDEKKSQRGLIYWFLPYFSNKIPINPQNKIYYNQKEWETLIRVRSWDTPYMICGEVNLKKRDTTYGLSWVDVLVDYFRFYGVNAIIDTNDENLAFEKRREAAANLLKTAIFNTSEGAQKLLDALKSTRIVIVKHGEKVCPKNHPADKDLRAAFENLCCSIAKASTPFRIASYSVKV